ncbi:hypothetical protein E2C00_17555 [Streptomyces sp. WAC05374]|uniref:hypothetical protein n=1 Tax=Streptomyces sp. WAC05374 TaxID=2487420 RepID=UPI000F881EF1|nr:hypothetical protein [Streptomyces sp. WAC05374]RST15001.1 hypothetical protein EF905_16070 [Streptomyces sp. WAC05374]TDF54708.1 hypothetical protein E2C00_17555 [Streptomyces sp. WAC05374]TDF56344.1 hypothetical protein E2C02_13010 [Streptomyces sp. WAC05374]
MADIFELTLTLDLRDDVSEEELAELRWHLGLGPQPDNLRIVPEFPFVLEDDHGQLVTENHPQPLLAAYGEASKVGGALVSVLLRREDTRRDAWALTSRQEIHPDAFERTGELLTWLATKAGHAHRCSDGSVSLGWTRFYENLRPDPLLVRNGMVTWPS